MTALPVAARERAVDERLGRARRRRSTRRCSRASARRPPRAPRAQRAHRRRRAAGERERGRERGPLGLPGAGRALVLVLAAEQQRRRSRARAARTRARAPRATGFRLCGIVDEPPPLGLGHLADLGLREQHDVEPDLRRTPAAAASSAPASSATGPRSRVPRHDRLRAARAPREGRDLGPSVAERRASPPAPPSCAGQRGRAEPRRASTSADEPPGGLQPEGRRHAPAGAACGPPSASSRCASARRGARGARAPSSSARIERARVARDEHRRGVEDVLAGRAACTCAARRDARAAPATSGYDRARVRPPSSHERARCRKLGRRSETPRASSGTTPRRTLRERALGLEHRRSQAPSETASRSGAGTNSAANVVNARRRRSAGRPACGCRTAERRPPASRPASRARPRRAPRAPGRPRSPRLVREVDPRQLVPEQPAREDVARRGAAPARRTAPASSTTNEKRPSASVPLRPQRPPADPRARPSRRRSASPCAVEQLAGELERRRVVQRASSFCGDRAEADRVERARPSATACRCHASSIGVVPGRRGRGRCPTGSRAPTRAASSRCRSVATSSSRAFGSRTAWRSGRARAAGRRGSTSA